MSDEPKEDFMQHCNNMNVPIQDFVSAFCSRCLQPQCQRSVAGRSLFEIRANNWEDKLFKSPAKMAPDDPRYSGIAAQNFIDIHPQSKFVPEVGAPPAASAWMDPRELEAPPEPPQPKPQKVAPPAPVQESPPPSENPEPAPESQRVDSETEQSQPKPAVPPAQRGPLQTPFQQGTMLEGATPQKPAAPPKDSWAATPAEAEPAPIIQSGAKIRFGKS